MSSPDLQPSGTYNRVMFIYKMSTGVIIKFHHHTIGHQAQPLNQN
jgi:hypothetical protein